MIGSQKNAATCSGPSSRIVASSASAESQATLRGAAGERADADLERLGADDARAVAGEPVVGALARDDHGALRLADEAPVAAHELDDGLDRLAAAAREEDGGIVHRRDRRDAVGEVGRRAARDVAVVRVRVQLPHLGGGRIRDLGAAVADVRVPEAAGRVDVAVALVVPEVAALAALEDQLAGGLHGVHVGDGMPEMGHAGQPIGAAVAGKRRSRVLGQPGPVIEPSPVFSFAFGQAPQ